MTEQRKPGLASQLLFTEAGAVGDEHLKDIIAAHCYAHDGTDRSAYVIAESVIVTMTRAYQLEKMRREDCEERVTGALKRVALEDIR